MRAFASICWLRCKFLHGRGARLAAPLGYARGAYAAHRRNFRPQLPKHRTNSR
jgi:hypothetical protein